MWLSPGSDEDKEVDMTLVRIWYLDARAQLIGYFRGQLNCLKTCT